MMRTRIVCIAVLMSGIILTSVCAYGHEAEGLYTKLLSLQVSEDISASGLQGKGVCYRKFSVPWNSDCLLEKGNMSTPRFLTVICHFHAR